MRRQERTLNGCRSLATIAAKGEFRMHLPKEIIPVGAMVFGLLVQNYAEWRAGGPIPPNAGPVRRVFPAVNDRTRLLALVIVSVAVPLVCLVSSVIGVAWSIAAIAAALVMNAIAQLASSLLAKRIQPGALAGLIFMLPPSLWVVMTLGSQLGWVPVVIGPLLSVPLLIGIWWLADVLGRGRD